MTFETTTKESRSVWKSPDGQREIHEVVLDYEGKPVTAKTYSHDIAVVGWQGTVESYEKQGRNGTETFVKQPPKEGGGYGGGNTAQTGSPGNRGSYQAKDEKAIQAMWAIGQSVQLLRSETEKEYEIGSIELFAQELFAMVDRVKATPQDVDPIHPVPEGDEFDKPLEENVQQTLSELAAEKRAQTIEAQQVPVDLAEIDKVFGLKEGKEEPWHKS